MLTYTMFGYILAGIAASIAIVVGVLLLQCNRHLGEEKSKASQLAERSNQAEQRAAMAEGQLVRYQPITDIEFVLTTTRTRIVQEQQEAQNVIAGYHTQLQHAKNQSDAQLRQAHEQYANIHAEIGVLRSELAHLNEQALFEAHGLYESRYDFGTAEEYKNKLDDVRELQKAMTKDGLAAVCKTTWTVEGSAAKGRKMVKNKIKLMLRAFNGECDAAVSRVKYNNIESLEKRVLRSFEAINKLGSVNQCEITNTYYQYKVGEIRLTHEYKEKLQAEKEEQRLIREQMREEEKAAKEIAAAEKSAATEEEKLAKAIAKAREQADKAAGERHDELLGKISELQGRLIEAANKRQRAVSRAQLTRSGHVYVISNIGSFGDHVYKIGMTRRLEPLDRVKELGDASVPFRFDVHAMIYAEDAPTLEKDLHRRFSEHQVNLVNSRKEFFRVELDAIETAVKDIHGDISFVRTAAADEYRKSLALRTRQHGTPANIASTR